MTNGTTRVFFSGNPKDFGLGALSIDLARLRFHVEAGAKTQLAQTEPSDMSGILCTGRFDVRGDENSEGLHSVTDIAEFYDSQICKSDCVISRIGPDIDCLDAFAEIGSAFSRNVPIFLKIEPNDEVSRKSLWYVTRMALKSVGMGNPLCPRRIWEANELLGKLVDCNLPYEDIDEYIEYLCGQDE